MVPQPPLLHTPTSTSPSSLVGVGDTPQPPEDARELFFFLFFCAYASQRGLVDPRLSRPSPPRALYPPHSTLSRPCREVSFRFGRRSRRRRYSCRSWLVAVTFPPKQHNTGISTLGGEEFDLAKFGIWNLKNQFPRLTKDWHSGCPLSVLSKRTQRPSRKTTGRGCSEGVQGQGRRKSSASNRAACRPVEGPEAKSAREARRGKSFLHHL